MGRSFLVSGFGKGSSAVNAEARKRMDRTEAARELALRGLLDSDLPIPGAGGETYRQRAERLGLDREGLGRIAGLFEKGLGGRTPASARHGAPAPVEIRGERGTATDSWTDGHGNQRTEVYTPVGGGRLRRSVVVEERVNAHTRLVTRVGSIR